MKKLTLLDFPVTLNLNQGPLSIYCLYQYNLLLASSNK